MNMPSKGSRIIIGVYYAVIDTDLREMDEYDGQCIISKGGQAAIYADENDAFSTRDSMASKHGEHYVVERVTVCKNCMTHL